MNHKVSEMWPRSIVVFLKLSLTMVVMFKQQNDREEIVNGIGDL